MTVEARAWLPDSALLDGALESRFAAIAQNWADKWCVPGAGTELRLERAGFGLPSAPGPRTWVSARRSARLALTARAPAIVARTLLGLKRPPPRKALGDHALVDALETKAVGDFAEMAGSLVPECRSLEREPLAAPPGPMDGKDGEGIIVSVGLKQHGILFDLFLRSDLACSARRTLAGPKPLPRNPGNLDEALRAQEVRVSALAGRGVLTLAEYSGLMAGDVLVLDRTLASGLEVVVNGLTIAGPRCDISETETGTALQITGEQHAG